MDNREELGWQILLRPASESATSSQLVSNSELVAPFFDNCVSLFVSSSLPGPFPPSPTPRLLSCSLPIPPHHSVCINRRQLLRPHRDGVVARQADRRPGLLLLLRDRGRQCRRWVALQSSRRRRRRQR